MFPHNFSSGNGTGMHCTGTPSIHSAFTMASEIQDIGFYHSHEGLFNIRAGLRQGIT